MTEQDEDNDPLYNTVEATINWLFSEGLENDASLAKRILDSGVDAEKLLAESTDVDGGAHAHCLELHDRRQSPLHLLATLLERSVKDSGAVLPASTCRDYGVQGMGPSHQTRSSKIPPVAAVTPASTEFRGRE